MSQKKDQKETSSQQSASEQNTDGEKQGDNFPSFVYIGDCEKKYVEFKTGNGVFVFPFGEPVEVPSESLAKKLSENPFFEKV